METSDNRRNFISSFVAGFGGQVVATVLALVSVPMSLAYFGQVRFGLYSIFGALIAYLSISNLGLNSGSSVLIGKTKDSLEKVLILRRSMLLMLLFLGVFFLLFVGVLSISEDWYMVLTGPIPSDLHREVQESLIAVVLFFFLNSVFSLFDSALSGYYRLTVVKLFELANTIFFFLSLVLTIGMKGDLVLYVLLNGLFKLLTNLVKWIYVERKLINERLSLVQCLQVKSANPETAFGFIMKSSLKFFVIGLASLAMQNTDNFIVSNFLGIEKVAAYAVTFKLVAISMTLIYLVTYSVMPLFSKALAELDWTWIAKNFANYFVVASLFGGLVWIGLVSFAGDFVTIWAGRSSYSGADVMFFLGGYLFLLSMTSLNFALLQVLNRINKAISITIVEGILKVVLAVSLISVLGVVGLAMSTFLAALLGSFLYLPFAIRKVTEGKVTINMTKTFGLFLGVVLPFSVLALAIQNIQDFLVRLLLSFLTVQGYLVAAFFLLPKDVKAVLKGKLCRRKIDAS